MSENMMDILIDLKVKKQKGEILTNIESRVLTELDKEYVAQQARLKSVRILHAERAAKYRANHHPR